jgi:hypothetical protein
MVRDGVRALCRLRQPANRHALTPRLPQSAGAATVVRTLGSGSFIDLGRMPSHAVSKPLLVDARD